MFFQKSNFLRFVGILGMVTVMAFSATIFVFADGPSPQDVEFEDGQSIFGMTAAVYYERVQWCDSDPDWDYAFYFYPHWADDPDDVRWVSWKWRIKQVFFHVYGGKLWGTQLNASPVILCIGEKGVLLAGGAEYVKQHLYIHHK